jgi:hypothetical protein
MAVLAAMFLATVLVSQPAQVHGQQTPPAQQHEEHHSDVTRPPGPVSAAPQANMMNMMANMKATDAKLDALMKKMNEAKGSAKTDAIAEVLTTLVEERHNMSEAMMANMMSMMKMMGLHDSHGEMIPMTPKK